MAVLGLLSAKATYAVGFGYLLLYNLMFIVCYKNSPGDFAPKPPPQTDAGGRFAYRRAPSQRANCHSPLHHDGKDDATLTRRKPKSLHSPPGPPLLRLATRTTIAMSRMSRSASRT